MSRDFSQVEWDQRVVDDCRQLIRLAVREDLDRFQDWTTLATIPREMQLTAILVARQPGVVAGLPAAELVLDEMEIDAQWTALVTDGQRVPAETHLATITSDAHSLLTGERTMLNFLGRLSGIATQTASYVECA